MSELDAIARRYASKPVAESNARGMDHPGAFGAASGLGASEIEADTASLRQDADEEAGTSDASSNFIEHIVSKSDTLAGLAIKHNVGVSDIKRANGLMSESMMWSRTKLLIPKSPLPLSDEAVMKYAALVNSGTSGGSGRGRFASFGQSSLSASSALDQLRNYYELPPEPGFMIQLPERSHYRSMSNPDAPGDVEMMVRSPTADSASPSAAATPVAQTDRWVDERVRLRKRGDSEGLAEPSTSGSPRSSSCLSRGCLPTQSDPAPVSHMLQSVRGAFLETFSDIMEKPPGASTSSGRSSLPSARAPSRGPSPNTSNGGAKRESFFQKLQRVSSQPALAPHGPSLSSIGDTLLRAGRDPLSANGSMSKPLRPVQSARGKGKAD